ncbi:MAG: hypothetical protein IPK80_27995 [Nannocystis sp.]|nr:hypothetical protein [Nannocystis sp.]
MKKSTRTIHGSLAWGLVLLLSAETPRVALARPGAPQQGNCELADHTCQAERWQRKAASATSPKFKAVYLHAAFLSYLARFDESGDTRALCSAHRALHRSLEIEDQPAEQRTSFEAARAELVSREKQRGVRCGSGQRASKSKAPIVATVGEPATPTNELDPPPAFLTSTTGADEGTTSGPMPLAGDVAESEPRKAEPIEAPASVSAERRPTQDRARLRVPGRPLLIAGSVALALGVTLGAVALYSRHQALAAYQAGLDLREQVPGAPDAETLARDADLETDYGRMGQVATGTAIGGGVALLAGAVMVAIGGRRLARRGSQTAWAPRSGGLAFHVRF